MIVDEDDRMSVASIDSSEETRNFEQNSGLPSQIESIEVIDTIDKPLYGKSDVQMNQLHVENVDQSTYFNLYLIFQHIIVNSKKLFY